MTLAGSVHITLSHQAGQVREVAAGVARPDAAAKLLTGKTPQQVLDTVPIIFSLCANAQAHAASLALHKALKLELSPEIDAAQHLLVHVETLREHAWRILLDWPQLLGHNPDKASVTALLKFDGVLKQNLFKQGAAFKFDSAIELDRAKVWQLISQLKTLLERAVFNSRLSTFLALATERQLQHWLEQNDSCPARLLSLLYESGWQAIGRNSLTCLPLLTAEELNRTMEQAGLRDFVRTPRWQGHCYENSLLNRQLANPLIADLSSRYGNGLLVRLVARLVEVAAIPEQLRSLLEQISACPSSHPTQTRSDGIGLAQAQAARGLLIHRVELVQGQVCDYKVVAPTEWNFQPDGLAVASLKQLQADSVEQLTQQAVLLINAIDPCVEYRLTLVGVDNRERVHA